ncbi:MAG: anthranilate synthase component I family protein [Planctomycetes bacterium]|nr:anthranilate synthase component I family protein [Planctomycetota bacterium]
MKRSDAAEAILWGSFGTDGARRILLLSDPRAELAIDLHGERAEAGPNPLERLEAFAGDLREGETAFVILGYDLKNAIERLPAPRPPLPRIPDLYAAAFREGRTLRENDAAVAPPGDGAFVCSDLRPVRSREAYVASIRRALDEIARGEIYQINIAQRFSFRFAGDPLAAFLALRAHDPAPFAAYLRARRFAMLSISPERLLARRGDRLRTEPIKGTCGRTGERAADRKRIADLAASEKERAELAMITDLHRNDLGRIARFGTVRVIRRRRFTRLAHVFHTHAVIEAALRPGVGLAEILRAVFPGGSVTGCPKIRAMELIHAFEPCARGPYTGAFGPIRPGGDFDLAMTIRTVFIDLREGAGWFDVGSGIVADSDPAREHEETLEKAESMFRALAGHALERTA